MQDEILSVLDANGVSRAILVPTRWDGDKNDLAIANYDKAITIDPETRDIIQNI